MYMSRHTAAYRCRATSLPSGRGLPEAFPVSFRRVDGVHVVIISMLGGPLVFRLLRRAYLSESGVPPHILMEGAVGSAYEP